MAKLMDEVKKRFAAEGYALKTERTYSHWIRKYIRYYLPRHPRELGSDEVNQYLTHLAVDCNVSPTTQNQCRAAILFLYRLLEIELDGIRIVVAKRDKRVPTVLTENETMQLIDNLQGVYKIMGQLLYGGGLRLSECLKLRVKDLDLYNRTIAVRDTKGNQDRVTCLPMSAISALQLHLRKVEAIHQEDLANGYGEIDMPYALARKYPHGAWEFGWQYVFPAAGLSKDPKSGRVGRWHIYDSSLQRAVREAAKKAGIIKPCGPHTLRHCFATDLLRSGMDIRTVQELMGHKKVETTMIYTHVLGAEAVRSPLDRHLPAHEIKQRLRV